MTCDWNLQRVDAWCAFLSFTGAGHFDDGRGNGSRDDETNSSSSMAFSSEEWVIFPLERNEARRLGEVVGWVWDHGAAGPGSENGMSAHGTGARSTGNSEEGVGWHSSPRAAVAVSPPTYDTPINRMIVLPIASRPLGSALASWTVPFGAAPRPVERLSCSDYFELHRSSRKASARCSRP